MSSVLINKFREKYSKTKKSLGQHFLTNQFFVEEIASVATENSPNANIIEIGPGCGVLTYALSQKSDNVTVIELDDYAVEFLTDNKAEFFPKIEIIHNDVMNVPLGDIYDGKAVIVGNLPYNVSVKILEHCTNSPNSVERLVFMFQKEVATRISAKPGVKDYSSLSVFCEYFYDIKKVRDIGGANFWPNANVMSTVLLLEPKSERLLSQEAEAGFFQFLRDAFTQKRKTLANNLKRYPGVAEALEQFKISPSIRAEQLTLEQFVAIYEKIKL